MSEDEDAALAEMIDNFQPGLYQHYKGQQYLALCLAREDETDEIVVVYTRLYARAGLPTSTRKLWIWNEEVEHQGQRVPRFSYCGHATDAVDSRGRPKQIPRSRRGLLGWVKDNF